MSCLEKQKMGLYQTIHYAWGATEFADIHVQFSSIPQSV